MPVMTRDQWAKAQKAFPSQAAADAWRRHNGIDVDGLPPLPSKSLPPELPPLSVKPISATQSSQSKATPMTDEYDNQTDEQVDDGALATLDEGNLDFAALKDPKIFNAIYRRQRSDIAKQTSNAAAQYQAAQQRIAQRNRGMSRSEQLFALSNALLTPTPIRGFAGVMGNLSGAFQDITRANRLAQQQREDQLAQLQEQYQAAEAARQGASTRTLLDMLKTYGVLNKPATSEWSATPEGVIFNKRTGFEKPRAEHVNALLRNPSMAQDFDIKFGPGAAAEILQRYQQGGQ